MNNGLRFDHQAHLLIFGFLLIILFFIFSVTILFVPVPGIILLIILIMFIVFLINLEIGFHFLIFFVPVGALIIRLNFFDLNIPDKLQKITHLQFYHVILLIFLICFLLHKSFKTSEKIPNLIKSRHIINYIFFLLISWSFISIFLSPHYLHGVFQFTNFLICIILFYIPIKIISKEVILKNAMMAWVLIGTTFALFAISDRIYAVYIDILTLDAFVYSFEHTILDSLTISFTSTMNHLRASGLHKFDHTSNLLNMTLPVALYFLVISFEKKNKYKFFYIFCVLSIIVARALIPNKAGVGAFFLMCILFFLMYKSIRKWLVTSMVTVMIIIAIIFLFTNVVFEKATDAGRLTKTVGYNKGSSLNVRWEWWTEAANMVIDKTGGIGLGMGGFKYHIKAPHPHSVIFSFFFDMGVLGLTFIILLTIFLLKIFYKALFIQNTDLDKCNFFFICGLFSFFIHSLVDFDYNIPEFWLFMGTAFASLNLTQIESQQGITNSLKQF